MLVVSDWASSSYVGNVYAADVEGGWCAHRGNHIHDVDQYTVLLSANAMVVK